MSIFGTGSNQRMDAVSTNPCFYPCHSLRCPPLMSSGFACADIVEQILGFLYLGLLQVPGTVCFMVWGSILCVFLLLAAIGYAFVQLGE